MSKLQVLWRMRTTSKIQYLLPLPLKLPPSMMLKAGRNESSLDQQILLCVFHSRGSTLDISETVKIYEDEI
jgi:hypothetical protein